jgi:hypothetical protein
MCKTLFRVSGVHTRASAPADNNTLHIRRCASVLSILPAAQPAARNSGVHPDSSVIFNSVAD